MRFRLHRVTGLFTNFFFKLEALTQLSRWRINNKPTGPDDFYSSWDYGKRYEIYQYVVETFQLQNVRLNYLEFGVAEGDSLKWWLEHCRHENAVFMGFDSFEGLPEDWGVFKKGEMAFGLESLKVQDPRLRIHKGWFQQTLNKALTDLPDDRRNIIHMDADLFTSTLFVLTQLFRYLKKDDIIIFDEFSTPTHEFNAFRFFVQSCYIKYKVIAAAGNYTFVVIQIL
jgi:O-methyltransferase